MEAKLKDWRQDNPALEVIGSYYQTILVYLQDQRLQYPIVIVLVLLSWWISYKLGGKRESHGVLSEDVKRQLEGFEQDVMILAISVEKASRRVKDMKYFRLLTAGIAVALLAYQSLLYGVNSSSTIMAAAGVAVVIVSAELYRIYLIRYISKMNFKIKQEQNELSQVIQSILNEMNDQMKNSLRQLVLSNAVRASETERESFRAQCEASLQLNKTQNEQDLSALKREYDAKVSGILSMSKSQLQSNSQITKQLLEIQLQQRRSIHCVNSICKKKRKLLKEKIKRNDWFIRNLSEFAWCSICAAHLNNSEPQKTGSQTPTPIHSRQDSLNVSFQADPSMITLDDSLMNNSTNTLNTLPDEKKTDNVTSPFQHLQEQAQQIMDMQEEKEDCQSGCLTKYFFLCRKVGEKYNEWTDLINTFESKYKHEREKLKRLSQPSSQQKDQEVQGSSAQESSSSKKI